MQIFLLTESMNNREEEIGTHYMQRNSIPIFVSSYFKRAVKGPDLLSIDRGCFETSKLVRMAAFRVSTQYFAKINSRHFKDENKSHAYRHVYFRTLSLYSL